MPGTAISQHLASCTADAFNDIVQIFRHDVNQYAGMLHTWLSLFESEISIEDESFAQATKNLERELSVFHENIQARLYPMYLPPSDQPDCQTHIYTWWDRFYEGFTAYLAPRLTGVEAKLRDYTGRPEFTATIQDSLGGSVNQERIDTLIFNTYNKLQALMDVDYFDRRVEEVVSMRQTNS